jgi:hypothetical protein
MNRLNVPIDLMQVGQVVPGHHPQHHGKRLRTALVVLAGSLEVRR